MCPKRPQSAAGATRLGAALLLAGAASLAPAQPAPPPASPPPPAPRSQWATAQRQSLLELEAADGRTMADREAVINVLGRSPTTVVEVARADQWLAPVLDAMAARTPASSAFHDDLVALAHRLREDAWGPAVVAFDNRVANWTVALGSPRPHTLALELATTFGMLPVADRSNMFDAADVALVAVYPETSPSLGQMGPLEATLSMVTDSRQGLLVAMSSAGEANRAHTFLASSRLATIEPPRLNERLRQALADSPPGDRGLRGVMDLSRAMRSLDPSVATWVQRSLGLASRDGTLVFEARERGEAIEWRLAPRDRGAVAGPPGGGSPPRSGATPGLGTFFEELPREDAFIVMVLGRSQAGLLLASYEDLVPPVADRAGEASGLQLEAELDQLTGVSFRSTVAPLLGERVGVVVFPAQAPDAEEAAPTLLLVLEALDEITLGRLLAEVVAARPAQAPSLAEALGLPAEQDLQYATQPERLAVALGPQARERLEQWRTAAGQHPAVEPTVWERVDVDTAELVGWVDLTRAVGNASPPQPLPVWWSSRNQPGGELELRGLVEAGVPRLAALVVDNIDLLDSHDPEIERRLELAKARMEAIDQAMRRYWADHGELPRGVEQLAALQGANAVGLDINDPFADPPQPLGLRLVGTSRWLVTSVGPDGHPDPADALYNPRLGIRSPGDLHVVGWVAVPGESVMSDVPRIP